MSLVLEEWQITEIKAKMLEPQNHTRSLTDQASSEKRRWNEQEGDEKGDQQGNQPWLEKVGWLKNIL